MTTEFAEEHRGGDFSPIEPTTRGGPDYGRFVEAVRTLQGHARAADAPDEVITEAVNPIEKVSTLAPYDADEWSSGRLVEGEAVPAEANALFVKLNPGQP